MYFDHGDTSEWSEVTYYINHRIQDRVRHRAAMLPTFHLLVVNLALYLRPFAFSRRKTRAVSLPLCGESSLEKPLSLP